MEIWNKAGLSPAERMELVERCAAIDKDLDNDKDVRIAACSTEVALLETIKKEACEMVCSNTPPYPIPQPRKVIP